MLERPKAKHVRCAIYTRKSSEEGLEQDFNSLQAQREACEAFIASQKHEGWRAIPTPYDDGGYSGGSIDRPALQQLLADIRSGSLDAVVVYKVDRLTRSLADFAKIVEAFDAHGVSFVSVTQQFNTTSSMGRLTLNILLSFAQFEREVTGERIRDKFAASKKRGLWMGGFVPLGYRPDGRTLVIHEAEAVVVRTIFGLYREHASVAKVESELRNRQIARPEFTTVTTGRAYGGRPFSRGQIYKLLANPIYVGDIGHKGHRYEGQHPGIIDRETWDAVRSQLAANTRARYIRLDAKAPSLLAGLLYDDRQNRFTPTHANKQGKRYRYYVLRTATATPPRRGRPKANDRSWRVPASDIETVVVETLRGAFLDRHWLLDRCMPPDSTLEQQQSAIAVGKHLSEQLGSAGAGETRELLLCLLTRVTLGSAEVRLGLNRPGLLARLSLAAPATGHPDANTEDLIQRQLPAKSAIRSRAAAADDLSITVSISLRHRGVETKLVIDPSGSQNTSRQPDPTLIKVVAQAHQWWDDIVSQRFPTIRALGRAYDKDERYVARLLRLAFLAPSIVDAIAIGNQPIDLTAQRLVTLPDLPLDWHAQEYAIAP